MAGGELDLPRFGETLPQSRETPEAEGLAPPSSEDERGLRVPGPLGGEAAPRAVLPRAADGSGRGHVLFRGADRERRVSAARCKQRVRSGGRELRAMRPAVRGGGREEANVLPLATGPTRPVGGVWPQVQGARRPIPSSKRVTGGALATNVPQAFLSLS